MQHQTHLASWPGHPRALPLAAVPLSPPPRALGWPAQGTWANTWAQQAQAGCPHFRLVAPYNLSSVSQAAPWSADLFTSSGEAGMAREPSQNQQADFSFRLEEVSRKSKHIFHNSSLAVAREAEPRRRAELTSQQGPEGWECAHRPGGLAGLGQAAWRAQPSSHGAGHSRQSSLLLAWISHPSTRVLAPRNL